ncbi:unnamed protein product [Aureobasidium uvarum]|uniref:Ribosome biogenesis protein SLX9 n=1 Tax=Aureobasidium uvarum TaxID=2773716 RepID=A0A9N8KNN0_9PEZI|nr:unnamed protein product [Aureobasidium uvarum]
MAQAPTNGKKRTTMRAKVAAASRPATTAPSATTSSSNTKAGKRALKHDTLISRIEKSQKKPLKRRRPGKKLNTALDSLADALPELEENTDDEWEGIDEDDKTDGMNGALGDLSKMVRVRKAKPADGKMKLKTLKSRPGALKRKQKMEESEKERFGKNLASMSVPAQSAPDASASSDRWAALRGFIGQTLEQNPGFAKKA